MVYKINNMESGALLGLPHLQQLLYFRGLRPYMDYSTGVVGIKRGISYQSLVEELYVEPHPGFKSGSPSKQQIQRALEGLERSGVIQRRSPLGTSGKKLILKCLLATWDNCTQNKADAKPMQPADVKSVQVQAVKSEHCSTSSLKPDVLERPQADTPPVSGTNTTLSLAREEICFIPENFQPSSAIIEKAKQYHCPTAGCRDELLKFISYHQSKGTKSCDWNAKFLGWLLRAKQYHQEKENVKRNHATSKKYSTSKNQSAVDYVFSANQELLEREGLVIEHNG